MKFLKAFLLMMALLAASHGALAKGKGFTLSGGYNYSTGDYGQDEKTEAHYVPVTGKWTWDAWTLKVVVPYISITGPGVVVDGVVVGGPAQPRRTESGLGDIIPSLSWTHRLHPSGTAAELTALVKLPTADEDKRLGTGLADYVLQAGLIQPAGKAYFHGNIGRRFNGSDHTFPLRDVWKTTLGAGYRLSDEFTLGAMYDYRERQTRAGDPLSMATAYGSHKITDEWSVQLYASAGFTDGSPDAAAGLQFTKSFDFWR